MPSSADPDGFSGHLAAQLARAVEEVCAAAAASASTPVVILVDGRSGAGKSTFASLLAAALGDADIVRLDDVYPGWDGLRAGAERALTDIIRPVRGGEAGAWETWDWPADAPSGVRRRIAVGGVLVVEGAGVLTPDSARLADVSVWLDAPSSSRRERALARDGEAYRPHWERWAAQEDAHIRDHDPRSLARFVVDLP